ncbi:MAG: hypothetical protein ACRELB_27360, partial [Polyangiaceae bacterium]
MADAIAGVAAAEASAESARPPAPAKKPAARPSAAASTSKKAARALAKMLHDAGAQEFPPADAGVWRAVVVTSIACMLLLAGIVWFKVEVEPQTPLTVHDAYGYAHTVTAEMDQGGALAALMSLAVAGAILAYALARARTRVRVSEEAYEETGWLGERAVPLDDRDEKHVTFAPGKIVLGAPCVWTWPQPLEVPAV